MQVSQHSHALQLVVRGVLILTLGISAAASDVIGAQGPVGVKAVGEGGGGQGKL